MSQYNLTKGMRKEIRRLLVVAYDREVKKNLEALALRFEAWKRGELDDGQFNQEIHEYHDGAARETWKAAHWSDDRLYIIRSVNDGYLSPDELSPRLLENIKPALSNPRNDE